MAGFCRRTFRFWRADGSAVIRPPAAGFRVFARAAAIFLPSCISCRLGLCHTDRELTFANATFDCLLVEGSGQAPSESASFQREAGPRCCPSPKSRPIRSGVWRHQWSERWESIERGHDRLARRDEVRHQTLVGGEIAPHIRRRCESHGLWRAPARPQDRDRACAEAPGTPRIDSSDDSQRAATPRGRGRGQRCRRDRSDSPGSLWASSRRRVV